MWPPPCLFPTFCSTVKSLVLNGPFYKLFKIVAKHNLCQTDVLVILFGQHCHRLHWAFKSWSFGMIIHPEQNQNILGIRLQNWTPFLAEKIDWEGRCLKSQVLDISTTCDLSSFKTTPPIQPLIGCLVFTNNPFGKTYAIWHIKASAIIIVILGANYPGLKDFLLKNKKEQVNWFVSFLHVGSTLRIFPQANFGGQESCWSE